MPKIGESPIERWLNDETFLRKSDTVPSSCCQLARFKANNFINSFFFIQSKFGSFFADWNGSTAIFTTFSLYINLWKPLAKAQIYNILRD